jgi:hypothetical protein
MEILHVRILISSIVRLVIVLLPKLIVTLIHSETKHYLINELTVDFD